jgi:AMMECR1 domain-containing protein
VLELNPKTNQVATVFESMSPEDMFLFYDAYPNTAEDSIRDRPYFTLINELRATRWILRGASGTYESVEDISINNSTINQANQEVISGEKL